MGTTRTLRAVSGAALAGALVLASAPQATADDVRDKQWPLNTLDAESIWKTTKGKGETVAVIDDGINPNHPDLKGNVLEGKDFIDGGSTKPKQSDDHGTGMASLIAGHGHGSGNTNGIMGLAPEARILSIRDQGFRDDGYAASIRYAVDHGASVINISQKQDRPLDRDAESKAIAYALKHNVIIVAGTGNDRGSVGYPAAYAGVVAVSGVEKEGTFWPESNHGSKTMLSAPASNILSAGGPSDLNGYGIGDGTSDATAYTSAAAALLRAEFPDLTAGQIANRLIKTAGLPDSEKGLKLPDEQYGYGYIQPLAALTEDIPKGSKYGPLSVPQATKDEQQAKADDKESAAMQEDADQKAIIVWSVIGVVILIFLGIITLIIVRVRRKKKNQSNGPGGPGGPDALGGYPYPGQTPGYGHPPHQQQQPMPPQPAAPPHPPQ